MKVTLIQIVFDAHGAIIKGLVKGLEEFEIVLYIDIRPSRVVKIEKSTKVNNRCIRSRNIRIITLIVDGLNECNCEDHKKKGALNYYITR